MTVPQKVQIGAPMTEFVGGSFNALVEEYWRRNGGPSNGRQTPAGSAARPVLPVLVKNTSGAAREPGHVLGVSGLILTLVEDAGQVYREPAVVGVTPVAADHAAKFVVLRDHLENNAIGPAWILGCGWVKGNITDTGHTHLKVKDGEASYLESGTSGAEIIATETGTTGTQWALVLLGGGGGSSGTRWGTVSTAAGASETEGTPAEDGEIDLYEAFGGDVGLPFKNYYPEVVPAGATACIDGDGNIITWSCSTW